ncbi:hypothetical protein [Porphyromonas levii]|uniref:hypothetical protein n=1 Tax=Porphyromonas levii TaxID=28114 RepID=UPI001BA9C432|nr:hypothetical protein [Porphyromonas levii]MBR8802806.1 hypothetical protein [Porphyromonas levii]
MKRIYKHIEYFSMVIALVVMILFSACSPEHRGAEPENNIEIVDGREFVASFGVQASNLPLNDLRSGGVESIKDIEHMRVLVFDEDQKFLYTADAVLGEATATAPEEDGVYLPDGKRDNIQNMRSFEVKLVESSKPRYLHFVADYDWKNFSQDYFLKGTSAGELMTQLHTTLQGGNGIIPTKAFSPMWSMVRVDKLDKTTLEGKVIKLLRNYAKIELVVADAVKDTDGFVIDGFCVANSLDKGLVAPFKVQNYSYEFPFKVTEATVPADAKFLAPPTDESMITLDKTFNLFESKNNHDTQKVCVVIRGKKGAETRYFKIDLVNRKNEFSINDYIQILRNNWYVINISRIKSEGYATLGDALKAPADNNVFASVEMKDFSKVSDGQYYLSADPIQMVIVKPGTYSFNALFNGTSEYTRFYPSWDSANDPFMGRWDPNPNPTDMNLTQLSFTVDHIPADNIEEYKVEVVGLRYVDKLGLNPGDPGYDPKKKTPVLDGVTGATTPITRTVHITLRSPYRFNAKLEKDPKGGSVSDMLLSFEVYKSLPQTLLPIEVLIEASDITPRNKGGNATSDLMIVEREVVVNGVKKKKLFYSYTLTPEAYKSAMAGDRRISIPVTINDGTAILPSPITLSSELYTNQTIYGVEGGSGTVAIRENAFVIDFLLPDDTQMTMPAAAENDIEFKLDGVPYNGDKINLMSVDNRGKFNLQILDNSISGTQKLEILAWLTRYNDYGYFSYLVKKEMTVAQWLEPSASVSFDGVSVSVKGFLYHYNNSNIRPFDAAPEIWGMYPGTYLDTNLTTDANYSLSNSGKDVNHEWGYEFTFTIPEETYVANAKSLRKWTGIGFGYSGQNIWPAKWSDLINSTRVTWWY